MSFLDQFGNWLVHEDRVMPADAILVLDGEDVDHRIPQGLDLLRRGYAPRLLVSQATHAELSFKQLQTLAWDDRKNICWMPNDTASIRDEAIKAREELMLLGCSSVLVVTSRYHTRRVKQIYARELESDGIRVRVVPAPAPELDQDPWWKSHAGRAAVLFESIKLLCTWLHFDLPISNGLRRRLKVWVERTIP